MILPTPRLVTIIGGLALLSLLGALSPLYQTIWFVGVLIFFVYIISEAIVLWYQPTPIISREMPNTMKLNSWNDIFLVIKNRSYRSQTLSVVDNIPEQCYSYSSFLETELAPRQKIELTYRVKALLRGDLKFGNIHVRLYSFLRLWQRQQTILSEKISYCYPDFSPLTRFNFRLRLQHSKIGPHLSRYNGGGMEFEQLREYQNSDALRQIDWKATTRFAKMISREYQEEHHQRLLILLDCGRRMGATNNVLSNFDHCLNTALMLAYTALKSGDSVGMVSFSDTTRYLPPQHSISSMNKFLHYAYNLHPTTSGSDFEKAMEFVIKQQKKRSLVMLFTNLQDEDEYSLLASMAILSPEHTLVVVSLLSDELDKILTAPITDESSALLHASAAHYLEQRARVIRQLKNRGVICIDTTPQNLLSDSIQFYLTLKAKTH